VADSSESKQGAPKRLEKPPPAGYFEGETMTRRTAFAVAGQAFGGAAVAVVALPTIGFALAPLFEEEGNDWQAVGPLANFTEDTYRQVVLTAVPGIGEAGKTTAYVRKAKTSDDPVLGEEGYIAISTRCVHLGCPVRYVGAAGNFICPCHGGVYDFDGKVIGGPPVRPLDRFQTRLSEDGAQLEVGPRFSVTSQLEPVRTRDPGEFTGGIWDYLYPPRPSTPPAP